MSTSELAPGVSVDEDGTLRLDLPAMCVAAGFPPSDENQNMLMLAAREVFGDAEISVEKVD